MKHVTYEDLVQQLCKYLLQVEYMWQDKECINRSDKEHWLQEIRQIHYIHSTVRYIIVTVTEIITYNVADVDHLDAFKSVKNTKSYIICDLN